MATDRDTPKTAPAWRTFVLVAGLAVAIASIAVIPGRGASTRVLEENAGGTGGTGTTGSTGGTGPTGTGISGTTGGTATQGLACAAGRNGGSTDVGVTATSIKLGATVVDSGVGASFLRDARYAMIAAKNKVNREGGVCGRKLELALHDDGWDPQLGAEFIRNLVEDEKVFALAVVPSSEGLRNISKAGYLKAHHVPVVGSDGMLAHQYTDPWIWPVAASTLSTMHIMARHAADAFKAQNFAIVYESTYHFGLEGAYAFNASVRRITGRDIPGYSNPLTSPKCEQRFCGISANVSSYGAEIQKVGDSCYSEPQCDFIALLLEPSTALKWIRGGGLMPPDGFHVGGVQPLFTRSFAEECHQRCHDLWLWTGYDPPLPGELGRPVMASYKSEVEGASSTADYTNTFVEGAYVGMGLLVQALRQVGPNLTRERLRVVLDATTYDSGLTRALSWRAGDHFANVHMRPFAIQYRDRFAGWAPQGAAVADPWIGQDLPP